MWKTLLGAMLLLAGCPGPEPSTSCGDHYECLTVEVPADWNNPLLGNYPLNVVVREATGDRIGPLFLNFGGPGATTSDYLPYFAAVFPALAAHFDLVAVDPRGTDEYSPLGDCMDGLDGWLDTEIDSLDPTVYATQKAAIGAWLDECQAVAPELTAHMGTMDTVHDLEAVRRALGGEPMTYVGFSYGTELGQMYADTYPHSLRAMYLDAVGRPGGAYLDFLDTQADGFQASYEDWQTWCAGDGASDCPMNADPAGEVTTVLDSLRVNPEPVSDGRTLDHTRALYGVLASLYSQSAWKDLATAVDKAGLDQPESLMSLSDGYFQRRGSTYLPLVAVYYLTTCQDKELPADDEEILDRAAAARERTPLFGVSTLIEPSACFAAGVANRPLPELVHATGSPTILLVIGAHDPATPASEGQAVAEALDNAQVLTWEGYGHSALYASDCVASAALHYLIDGDLPTVDSCP